MAVEADAHSVYSEEPCKCNNCGLARFRVKGQTVQHADAVHKLMGSSCPCSQHWAMQLWHTVHGRADTKTAFDLCGAEALSLSLSVCCLQLHRRPSC